MRQRRTRDRGTRSRKTHGGIGIWSAAPLLCLLLAPLSASAAEVEVTYDLSSSLVSVMHGASSIPVGSVSGQLVLRFPAAGLSGPPTGPIAVVDANLAFTTGGTGMGTGNNSLVLASPLLGGALTTGGSVQFVAGGNLHCNSCQVHCQVATCIVLATPSFTFYMSETVGFVSITPAKIPNYMSYGSSSIAFQTFTSTLSTAGATAAFQVRVVGQEIGRALVPDVPAIPAGGLALVVALAGIAGVHVLRRTMGSPRAGSGQGHAGR